MQVDWEPGPTEIVPNWTPHPLGRPLYHGIDLRSTVLRTGVTSNAASEDDDDDGDDKININY